MLDRINAAAGGPGIPLTLQSLAVARMERAPTSGVTIGQGAGAPTGTESIVPGVPGLAEQFKTFQGWKVDDAATGEETGSGLYVNGLDFTDLYDSPGLMGQVMRQVVEGWIAQGAPGLSGLTTPQLHSRLTTDVTLWKRFHDQVGNALGLNSVR